MIPKLATLAANYYLNSEGFSKEDLSMSRKWHSAVLFGTCLPTARLAL
jgi:hypothetical protein